MPKYRVYAKVSGSKYLGEFEAATPEEAEQLALESDEAAICLCHQCAGECESAEVEEVTVEEVKGN